MSFWVSLVDAVAVLVIAKLVWIAVRVPVLRFAAERGSVRAQLALGNMYGSGKGVDQDYDEAMRWFRKAAEQGSTAAMDNIGVLYELGYGVEQDKAEALRWYRMSAEHGGTDGMNSVGYAYLMGRELIRTRRRQ